MTMQSAYSTGQLLGEDDYLAGGFATEEEEDPNEWDAQSGVFRDRNTGNTFRPGDDVWRSPDGRLAFDRGEWVDAQQFDQRRDATSVLERMEPGFVAPSTSVGGGGGGSPQPMYEYPAAPAGFAGSGGEYPGAVIENVRSRFATGAIDEGAAQAELDQRLGFATLREQERADLESAREQALVAEQSAPQPRQGGGFGGLVRDIAGTVGGAAGAFVAPQVELVNRGLRAAGVDVPTPSDVGRATGIFGVTPVSEAQQVQSFVGDVAEPVGRVAATYALPALELTARGLNEAGVDVPLPSEIGGRVTRFAGEGAVPTTPLEALLALGFATPAVQRSLEAGESPLRAAGRGALEFFATDPTDELAVARRQGISGAVAQQAGEPQRFGLRLAGASDDVPLRPTRPIGEVAGAADETVLPPISGFTDAQLGRYTNDALRQMAADRGIDLGEATKKADIISALKQGSETPAELNALRALADEPDTVTALAQTGNAYDTMKRVGEAHLDNVDLQRKVAEGLRDVPILQQIVRTVNPSALAREEPVVRTFFEYKNLEAIQSAEKDAIMARLPDVPSLFRAGNDGMITVSTSASSTPVRVAFGDVATRPDKYILAPEQRQWITDAWQLIDAQRQRVDDIAALAQSKGIPVRDINQLPFGPGEHYWPRFTVDDGRLNVGGRIGKEQGVEKPRFFDDMTVGIQKGINYIPNPREQLDLYLTAMQKRERDIAYQLRLDDLKVGKVPSTGLKGDEPNLARIFSPEEQKLIKQQQGSAPALIRAANVPGVISRMMVTGLGDAGTFLLQLATTLDHPGIWSESVVRGLLNVFSDQEGRLLRSAKGLEAAKYGAIGGKNEYYEYAGKGGATGFRETVGRLGQNTGPRSVPGKLYDVASYPARNFFDGSINTARVNLFDSLTTLAKNHPDFRMNPAALEEEKYRIGRFVQTLTGGTNTGTLGISKTQQELESLAMFAPRYSRSGVALAAHALHGGITGSEAKKAITTFVLAGMGLSAAAAYEASNGDWKEVQKAITPGPTFMSWRDGPNNYGIGGIIRALIKMGGTAFDDPTKLDDLSMKNPLLSFARSRSSPTVGSVVDFMTGKDYVGKPVPNDLKGILKDPTDLLKYALDKVTPFTIGAYLEAKGDTWDKIQSAGASAGGLRQSPVPGWILEGESYDEVTKDSGKYNLGAVMPAAIAQAIQGIPYDELSSREKYDVRSVADPSARDSADRESRERNDPFYRYEQQQATIKGYYDGEFNQLASQLSAAPADQRYNILQAIKAKEDEMQKALRDVPYPGKDADPAKMSDIERLERVYRNIYDMVPLLPDGKANWDEITRLQDAMFAQTAKEDPTLAARLLYAVEDRVRREDNPLLQELDRVKPYLAELADVPKTVTNEKGETVPDYGRNRDNWFVERPEINSQLAYLGYARELHTWAAIDSYKAAHPDSPLPEVNLHSGFGPKTGSPSQMEVDFFKLPPGKPDEPSFRDQVRRATPELDVNLWRHGYVENLLSLQAYNMLDPRERAAFPGGR